MWTNYFCYVKQWHCFAVWDLGENTREGGSSIVCTSSLSRVGFARRYVRNSQERKKELQRKIRVPAVLWRVCFALRGAS